MVSKKKLKIIFSLKRQSLLNVLNNHLVNYPTPVNLSYFWNFGALAGVILLLQIITGVALAMHYASHIDLAFISVERIMRDVNSGWLIRYSHANGASFFFIIVYIHIARGLYYGSYFEPRAFVWILGVVILILMMATAFMGYVLPWGQMSLWGATVITSLFGAFPVVGNKIVTLLWGSFSVDNSTLNRFFSLHFLLPFLIAAVSSVHIALIHQDGSNNHLGINSFSDKISFFPYFFLKDALSVILFFVVFSFFVYFIPNFLGHPDNYIEGNAMITPEHIVPEFYFLPSYAILRSIPNKLLGVLALFFSLLVLLFLPFINTSELRSSIFRPIHRKFFWLFIIDFFLLGYIGQQTPETPFIEVGQIASIYYFGYFLIIIPALGIFETHFNKFSN